MKIIRCKSCGKETRTGYDGYCQVCWRYFKYDNFKVYDLPQYGKVQYVEDETDPQYGMVICHICGKAYTKLQQHIYYSHHIYKKDYCLQFGLDKKVRLTTEPYHMKMRDYAYQYDMPEQLKRTGVATRFETGHTKTYKRSFMTQERLRHTGLATYKKNFKKKKEVVI